MIDIEDKIKEALTNTRVHPGMGESLPAAELYNMRNPYTANENKITTADSKDRNISAIRFNSVGEIRGCARIRLGICQLKLTRIRRARLASES